VAVSVEAWDGGGWLVGKAACGGWEDVGDARKGLFFWIIIHLLGRAPAGFSTARYEGPKARQRRYSRNSLRRCVSASYPPIADPPLLGASHGDSRTLRGLPAQMALMNGQGENQSQVCRETNEQSNIHAGRPQGVRSARAD
jgi:hypothetical protein